MLFIIIDDSAFSAEEDEDSSSSSSQDSEEFVPVKGRKKKAPAKSTPAKKTPATNKRQKATPRAKPAAKTPSPRKINLDKIKPNRPRPRWNVTGRCYIINSISQSFSVNMLISLVLVIPPSVKPVVNKSDNTPGKKGRTPGKAGRKSLGMSRCSSTCKLTVDKLNQ